MLIRTKSSIQKNYYESIGQELLFGHDNIHFKTVNLPKRQRLLNLCKRFSVKLIVKKNSVSYKLVNLS